MNGDYSLTDSYTFTGQGDPANFLSKLAAQYIVPYATIALVAIIVLTIVIIFLLLSKIRKEGFQGPTFNVRDDISHFVRERMDPDRSTSAFAQQVQDPSGGTLNVNPTAASGQPGSLGYQVLHSSDFACDTRKPSTTDAWAWMNNVAKENMTTSPSDNAFTRTMSGY